MSIAKYAPFLGKRVLLSNEQGVIDGQLTSVTAWHHDDPKFTIKSFDVLVDIPLVEGGDWSLVEYEQPVLVEVPEPEDSLVGLVGPEDGIILRPTGLTDYSCKWELYIPPTQAGQLDHNGVPVAPWGATYWSSLTAALASLAIALKKGDVVFTDGRSAS